ncbi:MAG: hypothetical protein AAFV80_04705 [Bacteroidota bacterium]
MEVQDSADALIRRLSDHWLNVYYDRIQPALFHQVTETGRIMSDQTTKSAAFWLDLFQAYPLNEQLFTERSLSFLSPQRKIEDLWMYIDQVLHAPKYSLSAEFAYSYACLQKWNKKYPEHELLQLFEAFLRICDQPQSTASVATETNEMEASILDLLLNGMIQYGLKNEIDNQKLVVYLDTFYSKVLAFDSSLSSIMEKASEYILLVWYNRWLKNFKNKFISTTHDKG